MVYRFNTFYYNFYRIHLYNRSYVETSSIFRCFFSWVFIYFVITSMEISIIFIYLNLCKGDYNWIWKSFFVSASPAMYIAAYSVYYFFDLNITRFTASVANFCLMGFITCVIGLVCGTVGVCMTYVFVYFMHSKIKID